MIVLGIDPSLATGVAIVETGKPSILASACIKPGGKVRKDERLAWITDTLRAWVRREDPFEMIAIEIPAVGRMAASPLQWRLIGQLENAFRMYQIVHILPGHAKQAVGLKYRDKRKPVAEVEALTGQRLSDVKYASEAVADAVAVALAGAKQADALEGPWRIV